jgi:hypothetical protein
MLNSINKGANAVNIFKMEQNTKVFLRKWLAIIAGINVVFCIWAFDPAVIGIFFIMFLVVPINIFFIAVFLFFIWRHHTSNTVIYNRLKAAGIILVSIIALQFLLIWVVDTFEKHGGC